MNLFKYWDLLGTINPYLVIKILVGFALILTLLVPVLGLWLRKVRKVHRDAGILIEFYQMETITLDDERVKLSLELLEDRRSFTEQKSKYEFLIERLTADSANFQQMAEESKTILETRLVELDQARDVVKDLGQALANSYKLVGKVYRSYGDVQVSPTEVYFCQHPTVKRKKKVIPVS